MKIRTVASKALLLGSCLLLPLVALGYHYFAWPGDALEVLFANRDGLKLSGLLLRPSGQGRHPAVVILHGSGPETREQYRVEANHFARSGFATLVYDKRGTGGSEGDFDSATYGAFIEDAVAAVRYLRGRPDVDPDQIGLVGISEGGWLTPEVAERVGGIAFIVNKVGPPLPWIDTVSWELENDLRADGLDEGHLDEVVALVRSLWQYYVDTHRLGPAETAETRQAIESGIAALQGVPGFAELGLRVREYDPEDYARRAERYGYDPQPFLERMETPILYVFGGRDPNIPTEKSVAYLEGLIASGADNISLRIYQDLGHSLAKWTSLLTAGYPRSLFPWLAEWAKEHSSEGAPQPR